MKFGKYLGFVVLAALMTSLLAFAACSDDDKDGGDDASPTASPEEIAAVEQLVGDMAALDPTQQEDVDFFFAHVTDSLLEGTFQTTREECMTDAVSCIGEPSEIASFTNTTVSGDSASTDGEFDFGNYTVALVLEGDVWMLDGFSPISPEIPAGVTPIDLQLNEFAFGFNRSSIENGNIAFAAENIGEQNHEVIVAKLDEGVVLDDAIQFEGDGDPPGVTTITVAAGITPGSQFNVVFDEPLEPGRYALVCFFPDTDDPEETPHALKGMTAEFEVPAE